MRAVVAEELADGAAGISGGAPLPLEVAKAFDAHRASPRHI
jgi:hypothetical protein